MASQLCSPELQDVLASRIASLLRPVNRCNGSGGSTCSAAHSTR